MKREVQATTCAACRFEPAANGSFVCDTCSDNYHGLLPRVPDLARDLDIEITRQARKGSGGGGRTRSFERPLEFNQAASDALGRLRAVLVSTCLTLALGQALPADTIDAMVGWIMDNEAAVGLRPESGDMMTGLAGACEQGQKVIDNPPDRVFIGDCRACNRRRLAELDATHHTCVCGIVSDVATERERLEDRGRAVRITAKQVETYTVGRIKARTVQKWVERKKLHRDEHGKVRFGDALSLEARAG